MKHSDVLQSLLSHTGSLQPAPGASQAELNDLRRAFASSLRSGQSLEHIGSTASNQPIADSVRQDLEYLVAQDFDETHPTRLIRRDLAAGVHPNVEWAGIQPSQTLGPFLDELGRPHWFDLFVLHKPFRVSRGNQLLLVLPIGTQKRPNEAALSIPSGTVWIRANQLTSAVGADAWVGIRVKGGKVGFPQVSTLTGATLTVSPAAIVKLQIDLDPPTLAGPATGSGSEATHTDAALPTNAFFAFGPLGVDNISTAGASLKVYGNHLNLTRNASGATYEPALRMVLIPMTASANSLNIGTVRSSLFKPEGKAEIQKTAWGLIVTISQPENLGTAAGAGALVLALGRGITSTWLGLPKDEEPPALGKSFITADPMSLAVVCQHVNYYRGLQTLSLWKEKAGEERHSTIDISFPRPFLLTFNSSRNGFDSLLCEAQIGGHIDRPVTASGQRFPVDMHGSLIFLQSSTETIVGVGGTAQLPSGFHPTAVALTNALLTITSPAGLYLNGTLGNALRVEKGSLVLTAGIYDVLPILPDPYVANFEPRRGRDAPIGGVAMRANVKWPDPEHPIVDVTLDAPAAALDQMLPPANPRARDPFNLRVVNSNYWMFDVSSNADQFGVVLSIPPPQFAVSDQSRVDIRDLSLQFPGNQLYTILLPQFQWEAVYNIHNIRTGDVDGWLRTNVEGAAPGGGDAPSDGGPSFVRTESAKLVPLAPTPVAIEMVRAYTRDNARSRADFTLPFGIVAIAALQDERYSERPGLKLLKVRFDALQSAQQISLTTGKEQLRQISGHRVILLDGKLLAGRTVQLRNYVGSNRDNTLGILRDSFNNTFTTRVPIDRIDLSGYGASIFSRWVPPIKQDVGITQVSFDAFNGRTSYERIQMVTILWPCIGRLVRTIVLERQGSGAVLRWDSGWVSTTPGLFTHDQFKVIHKGVVEGMYDIREIYDTDQILTLPADDPQHDPAVVQAVYYDADIAFYPVAGQSVVETGQNSIGRVPAHRQLGFVQLVPYEPGRDYATDPARLLTQKQFDLLLQLVGPLGGPIDCKLRIGRSRQSMRITNFATDRGGSATPDPKTSEFANALFGSPVLPGSGSWSIVRVNTSERTVQPLDANRGVPLIQRNGGAYRWSDPIDLLDENNAKLDYALLMAQEAQRFLLQRPKIEINSPNISSTQQPKLADPYSMLSSTGLFPKIDDVIKLPASELTAATLKLATNILDLPAIPLPDKRLVDTSAWKDLADFSKASLKIDSLDNWKIHIKQAQQVLKFDVLGEIARLVHDFESSAADPSKFAETAMQFPPLLDAVTDVLNMLKSLTPFGGGLGPFKFSASFSGTTFSFSAVADFQLATKNGDAVESGVGKIKGNLRLGAELSAELLKRDIRGAVFLEITGSYQQLIFPFIYGGGLLRFLIRADQDGKTTLELDACTCGSIGGTIIPGLIDLEATVKYGYFIQVKTSVTPGIVLGMEGRASLISGLVAFKFGVEGRIIIDPQPLLSPNDDDRDIRLYGRIRVAGTVTLAWAIEESKSFETDFETRVNWKLAFAAAKAGLLPVP